MAHLGMPRCDPTSIRTAAPDASTALRTLLTIRFKACKLVAHQLALDRRLLISRSPTYALAAPGNTSAPEPDSSRP